MLPSCAKARPDMTGTPACVTWEADIAPLFAVRCGSCHTGATAADGYDTSTYLGVLGKGIEGAPNAAAGDPSSHLLTMLDPTTADAVHQPMSDISPTVRRWVVDCQLSLVQSSFARSAMARTSAAARPRSPV